MSARGKPLSEAARSVLRQNVTIDSEARTVQVTANMDPDTWAELSAALRTFGARYTGKRNSAKGSRFRFDLDPAPVVETMIETGVANPGDFYGTPSNVLETIEDETVICSMGLGIRILEPSAGMGAIADWLIEKLGLDGAQYTHLDAVEANSGMAHRLARKYADLSAVTVHHADFLDWTPEHGEQYGLIVMNPPFTSADDKNAYIRHIYRAWGMLAPGGIMVAVTPPNWTFNAPSLPTLFGWACDAPKTPEDFGGFVMQYGGYMQLGKGAFRASGTGVGAFLVFLQKDYKADSQYGDGDGYSNSATAGLMIHLKHDQLNFLQSRQIAYGEDAERRLFRKYGHLARGRVNWAEVADEMRGDYAPDAEERQRLAELLKKEEDDEKRADWGRAYGKATLRPKHGKITRIEDTPDDEAEEEAA